MESGEPRKWPVVGFGKDSQYEGLRTPTTDVGIVWVRVNDARGQFSPLHQCLPFAFHSRVFLVMEVFLLARRFFLADNCTWFRVYFLRTLVVVQ
jgi:hypothetical protein